LSFVFSTRSFWVLHVLTGMRMRILARTFCLSLLSFSFHSAFIHSFIAFCLFHSSFLSVAFSDTDLNADHGKILLSVLFSLFRFAFPAILWLNTNSYCRRFLDSFDRPGCLPMLEWLTAPALATFQYQSASDLQTDRGHHDILRIGIPTSANRRRKVCVRTWILFVNSIIEALRDRMASETRTRSW
jgi:hypothetical protein